jgi:hypothetical protein
VDSIKNIFSVSKTNYLRKERLFRTILRSKRFFIGLCFLMASWQVSAQLGGDRVYGFLNLSSAARVAGQAGFATANPYEDVNYGFYNPALLRREMHGMMSMNIGLLPAGIRLGEAVYAHHFEKAGTFSAGFKYLNYGEFLLTNQTAQVLGTFSAAEHALQFGYGYQIDTNWSFGANLKVVNSVYETYTSWGIAGDLSAVYQIPERRIVIAALARNFGTQLSYYNETPEPLPFDLQLAFSNRLAHLPLRWTFILNNLHRPDLTYQGDPTRITRDPITGDLTVEEPSLTNKIMRHVAVAAEFMPTKNLNAQIGYDFRRRYEMAMTTRRNSAGFTFGIGIKVSKFRLNYANTNMHPAARMHHISITTALDQFKKSKTAPQD